MDQEGFKAGAVTWHDVPADTSLESLQTSAAGLNQAEAEERLSTHGRNRLPQAARRNPFTRFLLHFHNILIYVLIGSALVTALLGHWMDTGVILAVVIANAIIGYIQEGKAEQALDAIRHMLAPRANVIRDGNRLTVSGEELVPGDLVLLEAGDKVPADLRLLTTHGLSMQEAILTGESVPVDKHTQPVAADSPLGERYCMGFSGTLVTNGQGKGVVVATGPATEIGRISGLLSGVETLTTPLVAQMDVFARWLTLVILVIAGGLLAFGHFVAHYDFSEMFMAVVGLSVAAIPEGLPAVLTITLAIGVQSMARRNAIVRRLPAIETLGSVSVICTDKTGTLTRNEMMVASIVTHDLCFSVGGSGYEPQGMLKLDESPVAPAEHGVLEEIARAAALCNDAALREHDQVWLVEGDPMEGALLALSGKMDINVRKEQAAWPRTGAIPFDARHRFMATLNHDHEGHASIFVKGAPEAILAMCADQRSPDGGTMPLDTAYWDKQTESIAASGERVLAFAVRAVPSAHTVLAHADTHGTLTLLGMVGMIDPPRVESLTAVAECHDAGIRVKMITGDHTRTAIAIAKQIGLQNTDAVLTGADLNGLDDAALAQAVLSCDVFARTSPEHKLRLVMALQAQGMTVAMTGDGVNDAPALKRADAGIAMGRKGSEAAKEASELVLVDDNFASIVAAIREGRTVYDNLKKVITWTLPTNAGEAMTIIVALILGVSLPVTPIQILWINLITAVTLGIALAFEPTEENTMLRPPRARNAPLLSGSLVWQIVITSTLFVVGVFAVHSYAMGQGYQVELARTMVVNTLVVMEIFYLFFVRNIYGTSLTWQSVRGTRVVWMTVITVTLAQFAMTYLPVLQTVFDTRPVSLVDGALIVLVGALLLALLEVEKQLRLRFQPENAGG